MALRKTVLDAELLSLSQRWQSERRDLATVPLEHLAAAQEGPGLEGVVSDRVTLKLVTAVADRSRAASWVRERGGEVISEGGSVLVVELPAEQVPELEGAGILRAEAARTLHPLLDQARGDATGLDRALGTVPSNGEGVVIGIVDTGVDYTHPDFQDDQGSRLELFSFASRPQGQQVSSFQEFDRDALNQALQGGGNIPQGDPNGHGTHCLSIAAGNGRGSDGQFRGVAPAASLVAVRSEPLLDTHTIYGIRRTFELAGERPAVVTLSLGSHLGPHDGTTALENVIARESGPGRIVVIAAGNEGQDSIHWSGDLLEGQDLLVPVAINDPQFQFVDLWIPRGDEVDVLVETPDGVQFEADGQTRFTPFGLFEAHFRQDPINQDQNLTFFIVQGQQNQTWQIRLSPRSVLHGEVHAWAGTANPGTSFNLFPGAQEREFSVDIPATEERAVSVGSFVSRNGFDSVQGSLVAGGLQVGQLSPFSSGGPTRYGFLKPDIAAPGQFITAALSSNSDLAGNQQRQHPLGIYSTIQGTSMATPFVAGLVALLLQREPELTPEEVQQRLRLTARRDGQTGRVWNSGFGFGKVDAEALLNYTG